VISSHTHEDARKEMFERAEKTEQRWLHARYQNNAKE